MRPMPAVPMPLTLGDLWHACSQSEDARQQLEEQVAEYHGAHAAFGVSTGRTALWLALRALRTLRPGRDVVILPAYTCPTVGRSVVEAGLRGLCVDISIDTFNIDPDEVADAIDDQVLAVVAPHMFGVPCDLAALSSICRAHGAYLIEDCAQCVGGKWAGQRVGTYGDIAFLSMGRSKNLRGYEGGVLWTKSQALAEPLREAFEHLPEPHLGTAHKLKQAAITMLSEPYLWAMAKRIPGLKVGAEDQSFDPHPSKLADWQAGLGLISLKRLDEYNERRKQLATIMRDALGGLEELRCQSVPAEAEPTCLRFATRLLGERGGKRDAIAARMQAANIDARAFYTRTIVNYEWWRADGERQPNRVSSAFVDANLILPTYLHEGCNEHIARLRDLILGSWDFEE